MDKQILQSLLDRSDYFVVLPPVPDFISHHLDAARKIVDSTESTAAAGTHSEYFNVSKERYRHYVAAAMACLPSPSKILDVGNAPGHVANLLTGLGHEVHGVNLNAQWRGTYPDQAWIERFNVIECDIESDPLPYSPKTFDAIVFTEVLEHIAIKNPKYLLEDFKRVLGPNGRIIFSTPNICNISNIIALASGKNVFWDPEIFYGSYDRHNREYTPAEVRSLFADTGFRELAFWGMSDHSNWRSGAAEAAYKAVAQFGETSALLRNTILGVYSVDG